MSKVVSSTYSYVHHLSEAGSFTMALRSILMQDTKKAVERKRESGCDVGKQHAAKKRATEHIQLLKTKRPD